MRIIHVLRKPLSEGTVASNVLKHGCGGLNIDASRISTEDNLNGGAYADNATHRAGEDMWTRDRKGVRRGKEHAGEYQQPTGRWPANVILQHLDGCRCDGVVNWICEPGCPVARLDANSLAGGMHSAGSSRSAKREAGKTGMFPMDGDGHRFGDSGGASRFFKQIGGKADG